MLQKVSKGICLLFLFSGVGCFAVCFNATYAQPIEPRENAGTADVFIGSTFKALAKAFVFAVDIQKLKKDNIARLRKMSEEKFRREFLKVYTAFKAYPFFMAKYGLKEDMAKAGVIERIESLDKEKIYEIIDSVPNAFIAGQFRLALVAARQRIQNSEIVLQISQLWNRIIKGAYTK